MSKRIPSVVHTPLVASIAPESPKPEAPVLPEAEAVPEVASEAPAPKKSSPKKKKAEKK